MGHGRGIGIRAQGRSTETAAITIDAEKCIGCGQCVSACQFDALSLVNSKAKLDQALCKGCRVCVRACPTGAIT
ncbi:4Fe-4S binding protein [Candidatus Bipolaricaulota bacterium]|nr:4Fe-4S binding protein [Candidatus Bipolaricaulota bacterium]